MSKTFYVSGPITGYADGNKPLFDHVTAVLRSRGMTIVSPLEMDSMKEFAETLHIHYGQAYWKVLARDVEIVGNSDGMILLPGWERSVGARLEVMAGLSKAEFEFFLWQPDTETLDRISSLSVLQQVYQAVYVRLVSP